MSKFFRHRIDPSFRGEFDDLYARMVTIVKGLKGYISHKVFTAEDGEESSDWLFQRLRSYRGMDVHPEHKYAKERGKADVFTEYDVIVAKVVEHHSKPAKPGA